MDRRGKPLPVRQLILYFYIQYSVSLWAVIERDNTYNCPNRNIWQLNDTWDQEDSVRGQKIKPSINWSCFPLIRFWRAVICIPLLTCLGVTSPALQTQVFWLNVSASTVFGVCTVECSKRHDSCYDLKKKTKQQGNVYKMWLFVMVEFTFTSTFTEKCLSSHKREVLDGCTMNSQLSTSSLSGLWINCAAEALTFCWHCAGRSICTHELKHSVPGSSPKL